MRERGLKPMRNFNQHYRFGVAPHAGAWVETLNLFYGIVLNMSLPMRERGLKLYIDSVVLNETSRSPCGSVG